LHEVFRNRTGSRSKIAPPARFHPENKTEMQAARGCVEAILLDSAGENKTEIL